MLAAIIEPMSTGMPSQPMPPNTTSTGSALGIITTSPAAMPPQTYIISGVIVANDQTGALNQAVEQLALGLVDDGDDARVDDAHVVELLARGLGVGRLLGGQLGLGVVHREDRHVLAIAAVACRLR